MTEARLLHHPPSNMWFSVPVEAVEGLLSRYPDLRVAERLPPEAEATGAAHLARQVVDVDEPRSFVRHVLDAANQERPQPWAAPVRGRVKWYHPDKGVGAIACDDTAPYDVWVHFSMIETSGYRTLEEGQPVELEYEPASQDSFRFRALRVRPLR